MAGLHLPRVFRAEDAHTWTGEQTFSAPVSLDDDVVLRLGSSDDTALDWSTAEATADTLVWGLGTSSKSLVLTDIGNVASSHDHAGQANPTLFVHSAKDPDTASDEWTSLTHDGTDGVIAVGSGNLNIGTNVAASGFYVGNEAPGGAPANVFSEIHSNSTAPAFAAFSHRAATSAGGVLLLGHSRGTEASPLGVASTDRLGLFSATGYHGSWENPAGIEFRVDGAPSGGVVPCGITLKTGFSTATRTTRLKVTSVGEVISGYGSDAQIELGANLDQTDWHIWRNVDGTVGDTFDIAGDVVRITVDTTNPGTELWNYAAGGPTGSTTWKVDKDGQVFGTGGTFGDGGATNYAAFAADGSLTLFGTAQKETKVTLVNAALGIGQTAPTVGITAGFVTWEFSIDDDATISWELPPSYAPGTPIDIDICWFIEEDFVTNSGEVQWEAGWWAVPEDGSETIDGPTHSGTIISGDINIPTNGGELLESTIGTIAGASLSPGDTIGLDVRRVDIDGGVDPGADPKAIHVHVEYAVDSFGN